MQKKSKWQLLNSLNKKGDVWISAVLYFGLGIVLLTIILTAGLPVINRIKDKNIATQTKDVFNSLDANIREVARGGPGTQRVLDLGLSKGELKIYDSINKMKNTDQKDIFDSLPPPPTGQQPPTELANVLLWQYNLKAAISEPGLLVTEGNTKILTTGGQGSYVIDYWLNFDSIYLKVDGSNTFSGGTKLTIRNIGSNCIVNNAFTTTCAAGTNPKLTISISQN